MGECCEKGFVKSIVYYTRAAKMGDLDAMESLSEIYLDGEDVQVDLGVSFEWTKLSAQGG
jgi:TPR repeat protein